MGLGSTRNPTSGSTRSGPRSSQGWSAAFFWRFACHGGHRDDRTLMDARSRRQRDFHANLNGPVSKLARCAIYTRKSTEHNLDLEFNSLDAQREACEAYIKSQVHEGWRLMPAGTTMGPSPAPRSSALRDPMADSKKRRRAERPSGPPPASTSTPPSTSNSRLTGALDCTRN
jgi:hypothetical protein